MIRISMLFCSLMLSTLVLSHGDEVHDEVENIYEDDLSTSDASENGKNSNKQVLLEINNQYKKNIKSIFEQKCLSCHGQRPDLPWYYSVPGAKHLIDYDMKEAKKHMDMTNDFPFAGHGSPLGDLKSIHKAITNDTMPPLRYKIMHWNSALTDDEVEQIKLWIKNAEVLLER